MATEVREHPKGGWGVWRDGELVTRTFTEETADSFRPQEPKTPGARGGRPPVTGAGA